MDTQKDLVDDPEAVEQLQLEVASLITAWADRGYSPRESACLLAGVSHMLMAKTGIPLGEVVKNVVTAWTRNNGKL